MEEALAELEVADHELRLQNDEMLDLMDGLDRERRRYRMLFEDAPDGYIITDTLGMRAKRTGLPACSSRCRRSCCAASRSAIRASGPAFRVPGAALAPGATGARDGLGSGAGAEGGQPGPCLDQCRRRAGRGRSADPLAAAGRKGSPRGARGEQKLHEERAARVASERLASHAKLLAEASQAFNEVQTKAETADRIAAFAVPLLADVCLLDLVQNQEVHRAAVAGRSGVDNRLLDRLRGMVLDPDAYDGPMRVLRSGEPDWLVPLDAAALASMAPIKEEREVFRGLDATGVISLPLRRNGRSLGALTFVYTGGRRPEADALVQMAAYADRAGVALAAAAAYDELARQREAAAAANQAKDRLLATVSHDFRTPLSAIIGYADLLLGGIIPDVPERALEWVHRIRAGADHQVALVDQILAFTQLESGGTTVELRPADLRDPVREACDLVQMTVERAGLEFCVNLPGEPLACRTDPGRVRQVLTNLLSNAVRYTSEGSVSVTLAREGKDARIHGVGQR
jgi:signal transduction histidine kinase